MFQHRPVRFQNPLPVDEAGEVEPGWAGVAASEAAAEGLDLHEEQAKHFSTQRALKELELRRRRGELIEIEDVKHQLGKAVTAARQKFLGIGTKAAPRLVNVTSLAEARREIDTLVKDALAELEAAIPPQKPAK